MSIEMIYKILQIHFLKSGFNMFQLEKNGPMPGLAMPGLHLEAPHLAIFVRLLRQTLHVEPGKSLEFSIYLYIYIYLFISLCISLFSYL